jgi:prevent-host-death family protein
MNRIIANIHEAKTKLSDLLKKVEAGYDVVIARNGQPIARLVSLSPDTPAPRRPGSLKGKIKLADDWDSQETNAQIAGFFFDGPTFPPDQKS